MPDLTSQLLPTLRSHTLPGLSFDVDANYQLPQYDGQSILNLPSTVCGLLGAPPLGAGPLIPEIFRLLGGDADSGIQRVILVLMDALALHRFRRWMIDGTSPQWAKLVEEGLLVPLTSVVPSTTSTALTTLWTGRSPAEHAVVGYELWLKEYGILANMITHAPASYQGDVGSLSKAGFDTNTFLQPLTIMGKHLVEHGIKTYVFQPSAIARSGLSQMLFGDYVSMRAFSSISEMWINVRMLLENRPRERLYAWVYWGLVDHFSHFYGPDDERPAAEFAAFTQALQHQLLDRLSPQAREGTLLMLTADHGAIATSKHTHYELHNHPELLNDLHIFPSGEGRLTYLFPRPGRSKALKTYIQDTWPGEFHLLDPRQLVDGGLFGPGIPHERLIDRLGEVIALPKGDAYWWWADKENKLLGRHGGFSSDEMLVPLVGIRLG